MFCSSRRVFATVTPLLLHTSRVMLVSYNSSKSMANWANSNYVVEPITESDVANDNNSGGYHGYLHSEHSSPSLAYDRSVAHVLPKKLNKPLPVATPETNTSIEEQQIMSSSLSHSKFHNNYKHRTGHTNENNELNDNTIKEEFEQREQEYEEYNAEQNKRKSRSNNGNYKDFLSWEWSSNDSNNASDTYNMNSSSSNSYEDEENHNKYRTKQSHVKTKRGSSSTGKGNDNNNSDDNDDDDGDEDLREYNIHHGDVNNGLITPPRAPRTLILKHKRDTSVNTHNNNNNNMTTRLKFENDKLETTPTMSSSSSSSEAPEVELNITQHVKPTSTNTATSTLTNPFRGLHERISRSYRLDPLMTGSTGNDILLARQERRSTAFSFLKFQASQAFYEGHWNSLHDLQQQQRQLWESSTCKNSSSSAKTSLTSHKNELYEGKNSQNVVDDKYGLPTNQFTLFNNNLGLHSWWIHSNYALIIAQRLLLFPDHMRHFHTICGRDNVPCDFFADVDLPDETKANGEQILLEILNYLEVRLPGVGFTDPFFLVLTNEEPSKDKVSYHIHARSMTYAKDYYTTMSTLLNNGDYSDSTDSGKEGKTKQMHNSRERGDQIYGEEELDVNETNSSDNNKKTKTSKRAGKEKHKDAMTKSKSKSKSKEGKNQIIAFQDFKTVKLIVEEINQTIGRAVIDESCYRPSGMLRCAFSAKLHSSQETNYRNAINNPKRRLVPLLKAEDPALQSKLDVMEQVLRTMTDPEILELTFCTRFINEPATARFVHEHLKKVIPEASVTDWSMSALSSSVEQKEQQYSAILRASSRHSFKLIKPRHILGPQTSQVQEYDNYGNAVSPYLCEAAKWRRYRMVVEKLHTLPPRVAEQYDTWVRIGLALHNFSNEDHVFEEWVRFSLKCPMKYSREVCKRKWIQFERNPDALNWRRGFNYLNTCIWRDV